jgi:hypothetical protein
MKALVLSLLVAAALWWSYQAGQNEVTIECQNRMASLSEQSEKSRKEDEVNINAIETKRVKDEQIASERSRLRAERLRASKPRVSDTPDKPACRITPESYVVLREAASDDRLPEAPDTTGPVNPSVPAPNAGQ